MAQPVIQPSFSAGELAPALHARVDLAKYHVGLALLRNCFVDYRGGVSNRAGTLQVGRCRPFSSGSSTPETISHTYRNIPFRFSTEDTYILEFGRLYMRVIRAGAYVLEPGFAITGVSQATTAQLTTTGPSFGTGAWVYIDGSDIVPADLKNAMNGRVFRLGGASPGNFMSSADTIGQSSVGGSSFNTTGLGAWVSGGVASRIFTLITPYEDDELFDLKFTQSADVMTITHPNHPPMDLTRTGHAAWTLEEVNFGSTIETPSITSISRDGSSGNRRRTVYYGVTAVNEFGEESPLSSPVQSPEFTSTDTVTFSMLFSQIAGAVNYNVYRSAISQNRDNTRNLQGRLGFLDSPPGRAYNDTFDDGVPSTAVDFSKGPPKHNNPFAPGKIRYITVNSGGSGYGSAASVNISDPTGSGFIGYPIVRDGQVRDIVVLNGGENYTAPVVTVTTGSGFSGTANVGPSTGTYPSAVAFCQQRKVYGGTLNDPAGFNMSRTGFFNNFDVESPTQDNDSIAASIESREVNNITSMIGMPDGLLILTGSGASLIRGAQPGEAITPRNIVASTQPTPGAAPIDAIVMGDSILYVTRSGQTVRDLQYDFARNAYIGADISILANHLLEKSVITTWSAAEDPLSLVWLANETGLFMSLTYVKEHSVIGWGSHETDGEVISFATIPERLPDPYNPDKNSFQDVTYAIVRRRVGGQYVFFNERFAERTLVDPYGNDVGLDGGWFLDCARRYDPVAVDATCQPNGVTGDITCLVTGDSEITDFVGKVIRVGGGRGLVTAQAGVPASGALLNVQLDKNIEDVLDDGTARQAEAGEWTVGTPTSTVLGLWNLEGRQVRVLGDGQNLGLFTVDNGTIELPEEYSMILVGLPYTSRIQTLPLDVGEPTIQGRRKKISALTVRLLETTKIKAGSTFETAKLFKFQGVPDGNEVLFTGDQRIIMDPAWATPGQICLEQENPFPMTILGVIPEVTVGDTAR